MVKPEKFDHLQLVFYFFYLFTVPLSGDCCYKYGDLTFPLFILAENSCRYICFINQIFKTDFKRKILMLFASSLLTRGFIQAILVSGRWYKRLSLLIDFLNSIFINFFSALFLGESD